MFFLVTEFKVDIPSRTSGFVGNLGIVRNGSIEDVADKLGLVRWKGDSRWKNLFFREKDLNDWENAEDICDSYRYGLLSAFTISEISELTGKI